MNHSDTKPLSGGMAEMASDPTRKHTAVTGMSRARPPSTSMLRVPVACSTLPAPRNQKPLEHGVVHQVVQPARSPMAASHGIPAAQP